MSLPLEEVSLGQYILRRLSQLGINTIFGVPGDYELPLLDQIPSNQWSGSPNELIAAYSADGYARVKGYGALITTFGPGETSALCGTAGSFCEFVPVLHIVGYPGVGAQKSGRILHHTLGDLDYDHYLKMSVEVTCAATVLTGVEGAVDEIDRVINAMIYHSRPAYLGIPVDLQTIKISTSQLQTPLSTPFNISTSSLPAIESLATKIITRIQSSTSPIIISDGGATRNQVLTEVSDLTDVLGCPVFTTLMGKGSVDEQKPQFCGVYNGKGGFADVVKAVESSDCVIWIGNFPSDFNTGGFTENIPLEKIIDFQRFYVKIGQETHETIIKPLLQQIITILKTETPVQKYSTKMPCTPYPTYKPSTSEEIKHAWLWQRLTAYLHPTDLIITETGCSQAGMTEAHLPSGSGLFTQAIFGSIGYAPGAAIGASIASKEAGRYKRLLLMEGDGSLQLTVQAFSILGRFGIVPVMFVINNGGYTVERLIHGLHAPYNQIPAWEYTSLLKTFAPDIESKSFKVTTAKELDELLKDKEFNEAGYPQASDSSFMFILCYMIGDLQFYVVIIGS